MTHTIKNLTDSPHDVYVADGGRVRLPARGEITVTLHPQYEGLYRALGYFEVSDGEDWSGMYEALTGEKPDKRWSEKTLISKVEELTA